MATRRRPLHQNAGPGLNFRPPESSQLNFRSQESCTVEGRGKKPLPEPSSISNVLLMMILHICRKTMFVDTSVKVAVYGGTLFLLSLITDIVPVPRSYFSSSGNIFNVYFVKLGWGWTLLVTFPFLVLTSFIYCCGKRELVFRHLARLGLASCLWYVWIRTFSYIESNYGRCMPNRKYNTKNVCLEGGGNWYGFDISGHSFLLIYSSLVLIEEARAIIGWEGIRDLIRNEDHARSSGEASVGSPLRSLTEDEFVSLKESYHKYTPCIRCLFIGMTCLCVLWDVMLISTILYYHIMLEKFLSGALAILMWFVTYRYLYPVMRNSPGEGLFKYKDLNINKSIPVSRRATTNLQGDIPRFMGMPLYATRNDDENQRIED